MKYISNSQNQFDKWHAVQSIDLTANTVWYDFVKSRLSTELLKNKTVLEIGCGRGDFTFWLARNYKNTNFQLVASDFSEIAIERAQKTAKELDINNVEYNVQDIQEINYDDEIFDIVISCETIEHVPNPVKAIKELFRVCKPGGTLILTTPNYLGFFGLYRFFLRLTGRKWTEVGQPINNFMLLPVTLRMVKSAGFKIIDFNSEIISTPYFGKKVKHFSWKRPRWFFKWFGLQSFLVAVK